ncbi:YlbF family regulator [Aerococcaceae bacterium zg-ZJ1578]|uniref:YlbF family regulator n=1 Tax=Aerococcaceae TaxID=186827 RepID=UPI0013B6DB41|nr:MULTISPECIES: YlbF family regulator [unclassified Facklamia]MBK0347398.1 YlbF family regulator [Aerococcaceae bacterium zg-1578]MBR7926982.1 YlbF family regulator [Aerococcaceae bacterium zg-ZUI334]MBS4461832.1 YlbF family regulator [Aerococcaceae bacterium zg-B36]QQD66351.1 YlbF family regulator [Aerococcaceae bacterium zg-252]NEW63633.1 hypothetical protein [Facklamia sp. 252]
MSQNNIYDTANQLERDLRNLDAYKTLVSSMKAIQEDEASNALFEEFKQLTQSFQMKQMTGEQPTEEEIKHYQEFSEKVVANESIKKLMESERQLSQVMEDINRIITVPLQEVYAGTKDNA